MSYCAKADIEAQFGPRNVEKWADIDNDGDADHIAARIAWAIATADGEIDDRLRGSFYYVPIVGYDGVPQAIKSMSVARAGVLLYDSRGIQDFDPDSGRALHRLEFFVKSFEVTVNGILSGRRKLNAVLTVTSRAPEVVTDD